MMRSVSSSASRVWITTGRSRAQREAQLRAEDRVLHVARREVVVIVEADLADRARRRQRVEPRAPPCRGRLPGFVGEHVRVMRMDADREAALRPRLRARVPACAISASSSAARMTSARDTPGLARPLDDRVEIGGELLAGEVTMRIDHCHDWRTRRLAERTRVPGARARRSITIGSAAVGTGGEHHAVRLDAPSSCAACRLATMTTILPTSASGSYASAMPARIVRGSASPAST